MPIKFNILDISKSFHTCSIFYIFIFKPNFTISKYKGNIFCFLFFSKRHHLSCSVKIIVSYFFCSNSVFPSIQALFTYYHSFS